MGNENFLDSFKDHRDFGLILILIIILMLILFVGMTRGASGGVNQYSNQNSQEKYFTQKKQIFQCLKTNYQIFCKC